MDDFASDSSRAIEPFRIEISDADLDDLRDRLGRTRWPAQMPDSCWRDGTDLAYLQELCAYWRDGFDWRAQESRLNEFAQFRTEIDGVGIHFIHQRSPEPTAMPLLMLHGWPGSFAEFQHLIGPLADPVSHSGTAQDAFHVVIPSLPGYGFSDAPSELGWNPRRMAQAFATLMARLGYSKYGVQGGDWGAIIATQLGVEDPDRIAGIHLNMVVALPSADLADLADLTEAETAAIGDMARYQQEGMGYVHIQASKPQTLAYALTDSPAGQCAWIVEKFREWTDCNGEVESALTRDQILTDVSIYWFTCSGGSSARLYLEGMKSGAFDAQQRVEVPTGCAIFPKEIFRPPRRWVEHAYNVVQWSEMEHGGHFAAMEQPVALTADVRKFFGTLR